MQRIKNLSDIPAFRAADGTRLREVIHPANDSVSLPYSLAHASLNPGERSLPHILDNDEVYAFLSGEGYFNRGSESFRVQAGDHVLVPSGEVQAVQNTGDVPLVFYCIVAPPWSSGSDRLV